MIRKCILSPKESYKNYIKLIGTGTSDMVQKSLEAGLAEPQFIQAEDFRTIIYRPNAAIAPPKYPEVTPEVTPEVKKLILASKGEQSKAELQQLLGLKDEKNFREVYLQKALNHEWFERTIPDKPNSKNQKYRLTAKGRALQELLKTQ